MTNKTSGLVHKLPVRVYYDDTDAGGIVYHANYLVFAERARTEFLRDVGYTHHQIMDQFKIFLVIRHIEIGYRAPARLDDMLEIQTSVLTRGKTSINMKQDFYRDGKLITEMTVTVVAISPQGKPVAMPKELHGVFEVTKA